MVSGSLRLVRVNCVWFCRPGGPTSQHDTIELHGFDGPQGDKTPPNKRQNKNAKNSE